MLSRFGHAQSPQLYSDSGFTMGIYDSSAIKNTREEMFAYIDNFVSCELEKIHLPLSGNMTALTIKGGDLLTTYIAIESMKTALLEGFMQEDEERYVLAFLHEVHSTIDAAVEKYKKDYPRYLNNTQPQLYTNGKPLVSLSREKEIIAGSSAITHLTYATGPIGEYFREFVATCHRRAQAMIEVSNQFDTLAFENFTIEEFRRVAQVVAGEIGGLKVKNKSAQALTVYLNERNIKRTRNHDLVPIPYADLDSFSLYYPGIANEEEALTIENYGDKALVASIGGGTDPDKQPIRKSTKNANTDEVVPSITHFKAPSGNRRIVFEEMPLPEPIPMNPVNLRVRQRWSATLTDLFNDPDDYILSHIYTPPDTRIATVEYDPNTKNFIVTAIGRGETTLEVFAENLSGESVATVKIIVSP